MRGIKEVNVIFIVALITVSIIGVCFYLNHLTFLKNLHKGKSTHNQRIIGAVSIFIFIFVILFIIIALH